MAVVIAILLIPVIAMYRVVKNEVDRQNHTGKYKKRPRKK